MAASPEAVLEVVPFPAPAEVGDFPKRAEGAAGDPNDAPPPKPPPSPPVCGTPKPPVLKRASTSW